MDKVTEQAIVDAFDLDQHYGPREIASLFAACARLATPAPDSEKLREVAQTCRDIAMHHMVAARVPECGVFGEIAQHLDAALGATS